MMNKSTNKDKKHSFDLLNNLTFCVFDLETTGGNPKVDKIIEIGLVKIKELKIIDEKNFLIKPGIKIPDFIQKLTSISQADVKDSPSIEDVIDEILLFMGDHILVAHNTSFDIPFFNSVLKLMGKKELLNKNICTNLMTKYLAPNLLNSNLNYMSNIFNIGHRKAHRALDDATATAELLIKFLNIFIDKDISKINHLYYPQNKYELDRQHFKKESSDEKEIIAKIKTLKMPFLIIVKGTHGVIQFALPCNGIQEEVDFIKQHIKKNAWHTVTIKLTGPFIESLIQFEDFFNRLESKLQDEILLFLKTKHLSSKGNDGQHYTHELNKKEKNGQLFFLTHHLVPEQLIIYPLEAPFKKLELVFRYPGHRKKLLQYLKSGKVLLKKNHVKPNADLYQLIQAYIQLQLSTTNDFLLISKNQVIKSPNTLISSLDKFLTKTSNPYGYPRHYI